MANNVTITATGAGGLPDATVLASYQIASTAQFSNTLEGVQATTAIAATTAANTVVKATKGILGRVLITATGTAAVLIYDNATTNSGTLIGYVPANAAPGSVWTFLMPAANGITVDGDAQLPAITISWA